MRKRAMLPLLALMMVPTLGSAATYWQITATTSPTALKTNLTAARPANFGNYTTPGGDSMSLTKVTATPYNTVDFVVAPVPGKAVIVKVDGVQVGTAPGTYTVNKGTLLNHNIVAYYTTANYTITTQPAAGGSITQSATYATNGSVTVTPASGYVVSGLIIGSTTYGLADSLPAGVSMTGGASGAIYTFASGSYTVKGVFAAAPAAKAIISSSGMTVATGATGIIIDGSTSSSNVAGTTYGWSASCGTIVPTADPKKATYTAPATVGSCTVTLAVNAAGVSPAPTATVNIATQSPAVISTQLCLDCHNGTDGPVVPGTFATNAHNGQASCVDCHNNGNTASHPYNTAAVMANSCTPCHNNVASAESVAWKGGAHGTASGHTTGTCQRCHASEGAVTGATVGWTGSYVTLIANQATVWTPLTSAVPPLASENGISCAVCHDPHTGTGLRAINTVAGGNVVPWDPNQNSQSNDQYDVCTSCHSLTDNTGALVGNYHDGGSINATRTISDTHYDNSATGVGLASTTIEGYALRAKSANACADCHNLHSADLTVQEQWSKSAHAGKIATEKYNAACAASLVAAGNPVGKACTDIQSSNRSYYENYIRTAAGIATLKAAGVTGTSGPAWEHYNWDQTSSRGACQRCHTSTGIANFLTSPATYDATGNGNNFSHLSGWTAATGSPQNELLYCWGCHSDSQTGALRNPGAITENYAAATVGAPVATVTYPNINQSNVCMGCHLGREIGQTVANDTDADGVRGFINSHYLTAGATIFNQSGYEYVGQNYDSFGYHKNVGVANAFNTGTAGPCVTCHMSGPEKHSFEASAASTACASCHSGLTAASLEVSKEQFGLALEQLRLALNAKGIFFQTGNPYFFTSATGSTAFTNWAGVYGLANWKNVMGAAFNYNMLIHDPGAFAHNRGYALKLIQDSLDFITDGVLDQQGVPAAFTAAATNKEFAEATSHPAAINAAADATSCGACHQSAPHYGGAYNTGNAQFVANNASCTDCHANNNTAANKAILVQYAESAHGDPAGAAWKTSSSHDWPNAATCRDCHSTTGFIAKVGGTTSKTAAVAGAGQTLACDACHSDLSVDGAVRPAGQVTVAYKSRTFDTTNAVWNAAASAVFPNVGAANNVCITCHAGRESGESILALTDASMSNTSFKNPHYLGAAGMMYAKLAFIDFTDRNTVVGSTTYGKSVTTTEDGGGLSSTHRKLGTSAIIGDHGIVEADNLHTGGPCVACHMSTVKDHTWEMNANSFNKVCVKCHTEEAGTPLTAANFKELFIEEQAQPFNDAIDLANATLLAKFNIQYTDAYPYFYDNNLTPAAAVKDWTRGGALSAADAKKLHGACLNIKLMKADPAAYAHARSYVRRVLYDTIDWLDDMTINMSTYATASAWNPVKYAAGVDSNTAPTTEATKFLRAYNRTSFAWNPGTTQRP